MYDSDYDSVTNNLRDSANGTFVTLDDFSPLTERGGKKLIWECYLGHEARVSQLLQHLPVRVETCSKQNGWTFPSPRFVVHFWPGVPFFIPMKS